MRRRYTLCLWGDGSRCHQVKSCHAGCTWEESGEDAPLVRVDSDVSLSEEVISALLGEAIEGELLSGEWREE
jgi:hypothetical protein